MVWRTEEEMEADLAQPHVAVSEERAAGVEAEASPPSVTIEGSPSPAVRVEESSDAVSKEGPPGTRKYTQVAAEAQEWFADFHAYHHRKFKWTLMQSIRKARDIAPDLFSDPHENTFRKWVRATGSEGKSGRPHKEALPTHVENVEMENKCFGN